MPSSRGSSRSSSRICAWIVTSSAVVGSSAISSFGLAGERHRDHHALAHAARHLVRVLVEPRLGATGSRRVASISTRALARLASTTPLVEPDRLDDLVADREDRVERRHRLLEDHRDLVAADRAHLALGELQRGRGRRSTIAAADDPPGGCDQPHDRERGHALAAAGLADDPERAARLDREVDPVDGPDDAAVRVGTHVRRFSTDSSSVMRSPSFRPPTASSRRARGAVRASGAARAEHGDVMLEHDSHPLGIARLEGCQQVTVLVHDSYRGPAASVADRSRPDPGRDRPPDLHRVRAGRRRR